MSIYSIETKRLRLRPMADEDLDRMAALLGDPVVMRHYPAPKSRAEAQQWIHWNKRNYAYHGFGLWIVETKDGGFLGDCGLTMQVVDGITEVEVGYHILPGYQGRGYATEAASGCLEYARQMELPRVVAIINPANIPSQRVALKCGLTLEKRTEAGGLEQLVYAGRAFSMATGPRTMDEKRPQPFLQIQGNHA